jgi:hypothetical protein
MKINPKDYRIHEGEQVRLHKWPTRVKPVYRSQQHYQELLAEHVDRMSTQQQLLYASNAHSILLIFQAMDAAGKDGAIRHVMSGVNPQGCQVSSFKHPSAAEASGVIATDRSTRWSGTCMPMGPGSSSFICTCPRTNSDAASWSASMTRRRTGNSALPTSRSAATGSST